MYIIIIMYLRKILWKYKIYIKKETKMSIVNLKDDQTDSKRPWNQSHLKSTELD